MTEKEGKYIYCLIPTDKVISFGNFGIGKRNDEVSTICYKEIAAVVSNSPIIDYKVSRENLILHEKAIEEVMLKFTVLPVKFGTIAESEEKIKDILSKEYDKFNSLFEKMKDKKEVGLKAIFKENVIFQQILDKYEDIAKYKEIIASKPPEKTHFQRARIGEMVENALEQEKSLYKKIILDTLTTISEESVTNKEYGSKMVLNAAFLINIKKEEIFYKAVNALDTEHGNVINFKYLVLVPPFNFVNLVINL